MGKVNMASDLTRLERYIGWVINCRHGISKKTARHYAQMMIRADEEGLKTVDDATDKYFMWSRSVRADVRSGVRLRNEFNIEVGGIQPSVDGQPSDRWVVALPVENEKETVC